MKGKLGFGMLALGVCVAWTGIANATTRTVTCTNTAGSDPGVMNPVIAASSPGDVIEISGLCAGDYLVTTSGLTFANRTASSTLSTTDGFNAMVEVYGASREQFIGITMTGTNLTSSRGSSAAGSNYFEIGALVVHDGGSATITNTAIQNSNTSGLWVEHGSSATVLGTTSTISNNGASSANIYASGIVIQSGSNVQLGTIDGLNTAAVNGNGVSSASCEGYGIQMGQGATLIAYEVTIGTSGASNGCGDIYMVGSTARLLGTTLGQAGTFGPGIAAYSSSSVSLDTDYSDQNIGGIHGATKINAGGHASLLLAGASSAIIGGATLTTTTPTQATLEVSMNSTAILAGGNTIQNTSPTGFAIQIDHSSSLAQQPGFLFADPVGADTISGAGAVQVQSSMDLGEGLISPGSTPSLVWNLTGNQILNVQQNSSFRLSGGVSITGGSGVKIQQGSNAFFNVNNGGTNTATVVCANSANNPMAHVSNPGSVSSVTMYNLNDVLAGDTAATHPGQTNACLNF
jgi:trimeric autotransporter adhesin